MLPALLLCDDLMFVSRISGEARALGLSVKSARSVEQFLDLARRETPSCMILDLSFPRLDLSELFGLLSAACPVLPRVVAYGSHVDAELLKAARLAGCDPVLPRSKFVEELPRELPSWMGGGPEE